MGYSYYDTPDGQDCYKKIWCAAKMAGVTGLFASSIDVLMISHTKGYGPTLGKFGYITLPLIGISAVFSATTCMVTSYRGKDDIINHLIGGMVAGSLFGVWAKSYNVGTLAAIACGVAAVVKKDALMEGWEFFPDKETFGWGDFRSIHYDFSLTKERPRQWKAAGEE